MSMANNYSLCNNPHDLDSNDPHPNNVIKSNPSSGEGEEKVNGCHGHEYVVLFYRYFLPTQRDHPGDDEDDDDTSKKEQQRTDKKDEEKQLCSNDKENSSVLTLLFKHSDYYMPKLQQFLQTTCSKLRMKGRIRLSAEGINGTLSAIDKHTMDQFVDNLGQFNIISVLGLPPSYDDTIVVVDSKIHKKDGQLFTDIDWKYSTTHEQKNENKNCEPFPDLKVELVKEIVSSGGAIDVSDIPIYGGKHLTPEQFHQTLMESWCTNSTHDNDNNNCRAKEIVLIDVRNPYEYDIGHFQSPDGSTVAVNPQMSTFATFDKQYCARQADNLKDKKVLMYCTGGIRCEKASAMLRKRGVEDVNQLSGGIHRYLETYGNSGLFQGKNFVFDQRVTMSPSSTYHDHKSTDYNNISSLTSSLETLSTNNHTQQDKIDKVIGTCVSCAKPYDEYSGSRICTVCKELVLVCPSCCQRLREYHCPRHYAWQSFYFTFLEVFTEDELTIQLSKLHESMEQIMDQSANKKGSNGNSNTKKRNVRQTLLKQAKKIQERISALQGGSVMVDKNAPRKCRCCFQTNDLCDGLCWGFWKQKLNDGTSASEIKLQ